MPALFTVTLFVSAFLLFLVQPMVGKMVTPLLGGTPAVWVTCMVFFQALLLAGYAYAHAATARLGTRRQAVLHLGLLLLPLLALPVAVPADWSLSDPARPVLPLLGLLLLTVGLPFFVVSTGGPLLQRWFAATGHPRSADPYFLYAASNLGSMLALLGYPFLLESQAGLAEQSRLWAAGYGLLVLLVAACAVVVLRTAPADPAPERPAEPRQPLPWSRRLRWVLLAFVPSSLMLSVTTYLTQDIAAIPLLWVLPLALYLLTFILVFSRRTLLPLPVVLRWLPLVALVIAFVLLSEATEPVRVLIGIHLIGLFWVGTACHGLLAADRPEVGHLTEFYLWLSAGGVLGGLFNAVVAPLVFSSVLEYPVVLVLACLLRPAPAPVLRRRPVRRPEPALALVPAAAASATEPAPWSVAPASAENGGSAEKPERDPEPLRRRLDFALPVVLGVITAGLVLGCQALRVEPGPKSWAWMFAVPAVICYTFLDRPLRFGLGVAALLAAGGLYEGMLGEVLYRTRSFFGVHRVTLDPTRQFRVLAHGNTVHGRQSVDPARKGEALSYYFKNGPVGRVFHALPNDPRPGRVGIIGLGSGTMASYAKKGQHWTYFEIDPAVARIAQDPRLFTFCTDAQARGVELDVVFGDARLTLQRTDERFGVIVIDAFSSDAIPVHLLTREAMRVYLDRLEEGGFLLFNISNRYLDLEPVLAALAETSDPPLACLLEDDRSLSDSERRKGKAPSQWAVMARQAEYLPPVRGRGGVWLPPKPRPGMPVWTDDFSNLFRVFRLGSEGDD